MSQTFSVRSNAVRNARSKLGKNAKLGVHFTVNKADGENTTYTWDPIADAPAVEAEAEKPVAVISPAKVKAKVKAKVRARRTNSAKHKIAASRRRPVAKTSKTGRRAGRKALTNISGITGKRKQVLRSVLRAKGAALDVLCNLTGWQRHTVRGVISTLGSDFGVKIKSYRDAHRGRVYQLS